MPKNPKPPYESLPNPKHPTTNAQPYGWIHNPEHSLSYAARPAVRRLSEVAPQLFRGIKAQDTFLWRPLLVCKPSWRRGNQAIGSCVAWGAELVATMLMAIQHAAGESTWVEEAATEPIYGGRAELGQGGWSDGWWGSGAAEWLTKAGGVLLRIDYSAETGNPESDLRSYSGKKEKDWGFYGCGGRQDGRMGQLDAIAKSHPIKVATAIRNCDELEALILSGRPCTVASGVGYGSMNRDANGVVRRSGSWAHQMMFAGIKYLGGKRYFRQFQSWGPQSCSGPDPGITDPAVSGCSWWTHEADAQVQLNEGDSFGFAEAAGWPARTLDFLKAASTWGT